MLNNAPTNENRNRWYGLRPGDEVDFMGHTGTVVELHGFDNNGCTVRYEDGHEGMAVCEWCKVLTRVEDHAAV